MGIVRRWAVVAFVIAALGASGVGAVMLALRTEDRVEALDPIDRPILLPVSAGTADDSTLVEIALTYSDPVSILTPKGLTGIVTNVTEYQVILPGDSVIEIDGVWRLAWPSNAPFFRTLNRRDEGEDVFELQSMLKSLGFFDREPAEQYDSFTARAVQNFAITIGADPATEWWLQPFDPQWVLWMPVDRLLSFSLTVGIGEQAPPVGAPIATGTPTPEGGSVTTESGDSPIANGVWAAEIGTKVLKFVDGSPFGGWSAVEAAVLEVSSFESVFGGEPTPAIVRRDIKRDFVAVPVPAVRLDSTGVTCVFVADAASNYTPRLVQLGRGRLSAIEVASGVSVGEMILANQAAILGPTASCSP